MPKATVRPMVEALRAALVEAETDPALRRAWGDLRETCGSVLSPRADLVPLVVQYLAYGLREGVIASAVEPVLNRIDVDRPAEPLLGGATIKVPALGIRPLLTEIDGLMRTHFGTSITSPGVRILDPRAGTGDVVEAVGRLVGLDDRSRKIEQELFANESRLGCFLLASKRLEPFPGLAFANSLKLPKPSPTPGFDFDMVPNSDRIRRQQDSPIDVIVSDLRGVAQVRRHLQWASSRIGNGIIGMLNDGAWIDEPDLAAFRAELERNFGLILHDVAVGFTILVRSSTLKRSHARVLYRSEGAEKELHPTAAHVWRPEILREEWQEFMPLIGKNSVFVESIDGVDPGLDRAVEAPKTRPVLRRPFVRAWRPVKRGVPWSTGGLALVAMSDPFGAFVTNCPAEKKFGPAFPFRIGSRENISARTMARFRVAYGSGLAERDVFDYLVALMHHRGYRERYFEDLRRGPARIPLLDLSALLEASSPPVGPGTTYGTGWTPGGFYEEGVVPDYDEPFGSPYARGEIKPEFLLFAGLGAALSHLHLHSEQIRCTPLERFKEGGVMKLSRDRTRVVVGPSLSVGGIPPQALEYRVGKRSALEWLIEGMKGLEIPPEIAAKRVDQVVALSLEANRLIEIAGMTALPSR